MWKNPPQTNRFRHKNVFIDTKWGKESERRRTSSWSSMTSLWFQTVPHQECELKWDTPKWTKSHKHLVYKILFIRSRKNLFNISHLVWYLLKGTSKACPTISHFYFLINLKIYDTEHVSNSSLRSHTGYK